MQDLDKFKNEMNLSGQNVYVGHRYVPKIMGDWDSTQIYEPLSIVQYQGNSFTSRQFVPSGVELTNEEYWASTGNYNAQVEQYRQDVVNLKNDVSKLNNLNSEVIDARNGEENLSDRLNKEHQEVSTLLGQTVDDLNSRGVLLSSFDGENKEKFEQAMVYSSLNNIPIYIDEGVYEFTNDLIINTNSIFIGLGNVEFNLNENCKIIINEFGSGSKLENIKINGNGFDVRLLLNSTNNIELKKIEIVNTLFSGIEFRQSSKVTLDDFKIENVWLDNIEKPTGALYIFQSEYVNVLNGFIKNTGSKGVNIGGSHNVYVENVSVDETTHAAGDGLYSNGSKYVTFKKCKVTNVTSNALKLSRGTKYSNIIECDLEVNNSVGNVIRLQGASFTKVERNIVNNNGTKQSIEVVPHVISGDDADNNILDGNVFIDSGNITNISIYGHDGFSCDGNKILNHYFESNVGVNLTRNTNTIIEKNNFTNNTLNALSITNSAFTVNNNVFNDNKLDIFLRSGEAIITNNRFRGLEGTSTSSITTNNEISKINVSNNDFLGYYSDYLVRVYDGLIVVISGNMINVSIGTISIPSGTGIFSNNYVLNGTVSLSTEVVKSGNIEP